MLVEDPVFSGDKKFSLIHINIINSFGAITSTEISSYPKPLRKALDRVDREIDELIDEATFLSHGT